MKNEKKCQEVKRGRKYFFRKVVKKKLSDFNLRMGRQNT